jgi:hypothetical protein
MEIKDISLNNEHKVVVEYVVKNEYGKFKKVFEEFEYHEDGDPIFMLSTDSYKKLMHTDKSKQLWKVVTTEGMQRYLMRNPDKNFWIVEETTGNTFKFIMPDKD